MKRSHWSLTVVAGGALLATALQGMVPAEAQTRATGFQVGDRILLHVERDSALSDTFTVVAGPARGLSNTGGRSVAGQRPGGYRAHFRPPRWAYIHDPPGRARARFRDAGGAARRPRGE